MPKDYLNDLDITRYDGPKLATSGQVRTILHLTGHGTNISTTVLEQALERHCGKWTGTLHHELTHETAIIKRGRIFQNWSEARQQYPDGKWVMPPQVED